MFEKFTGEARIAVVAAQEVARDTGSRSIDTRHVLVALAESDGPAALALRAVGAPSDIAARLREGLRTGGLDAEALASLGVDLDAVRGRAEEVFGPGALDRVRRSRGHIPFSSDAKKALKQALREAMRRKERAIEGRHLLLGMLRADSPARDALATAGVDTDRLRAVLDGPGPGARSA